jgi:8-oxo-dGTP diphosphatase
VVPEPPPQPATGASRVPCVGAVVTDCEGRLLLVQRANEPGRGLWSVPGGRVEPGESPQEAVVREVEEETGLPVVVTCLAGVVERPAPGGGTYVIEDYVARVAPGADPASLRAGDDALAAAWVAVEELDGLPCVEGLLAALRAWRCLP